MIKELSRFVALGILMLLASVGANHLYDVTMHRSPVVVRHIAPGVGEGADVQNRINMLIQIYDATTGVAKELARELIVAEGQANIAVLPLQQRKIVDEMYWRAPKTLSIRVGDSVKVEDKIIMKETK